MKPRGQCSRCGAPLPADLAVSVCPQCELRGALDPLADLSGVLVPGPGSDGPAALAAPSSGEQWQSFSPKRLGDYELLEEIARGGMGIVYRARQVSLDRIVAVKTLLAGPLASKDFVHRFRTEAAAAASLHHPNIVAIHEVGFAEGQHFFAMDYVEGPTLAQLVAKGPLPPRQAAKYLQTIAEAIHFAHERNVLHRDLKPSNVIIDSATDQPRVTDFGLAKRLAAETDLTLSGQVLGSPNFMSPEQAAARRGTVGRRSDVYSLGALLYHLLTGRAPFQGETLTDVLHQVMTNDPLAPHLLTPKLPRDLETICLKCLEKEPARRYQTAQELADELGRFLQDEPILARPIGLTGKAWRWCRRKPVVASLAATSLVLLLTVAIGGPIAAYRINQERLAANQERSLTRLGKYASDMRLASEAVREGQFDHARGLLRGHEPRPGEKDLRGFEWRYLAREVQASEPIRVLDGLPAPSGWEQTLLFRSEQYLYNQSGDQRKAWDMTTWEPVPIVPPPQPVSVHWQWDLVRGSAYAVDRETHSLTVFTLPLFKPRGTLTFPGPTTKVEMRQDGQALAVGFQEGTAHRVLVWDLTRNATIGTLGDFEAAISALAFSRDGTRLAAGSTDGGIGIWDLPSLTSLPAPPRKAFHVDRLAFSPDLQRLLSCWWGHLPTAWDLAQRQELTVDSVGQGELNFVAVSPDGECFVEGWYGDGFRLTFHDLQTFRVKGTLSAPPGVVGAVEFSPDGKLIAGASSDQTARIWDLATRTEIAILGGFGQSICDVEFSGDGQHIVLIGGFGEVRVYRLAEVLRRGLFAGPPGVEPLIDLAMSPDDHRLATIGPGGTLAVRDRQSRALLRSVSFPQYTSKSYPRVVFSPDGDRVFWVTGDALRMMQIESEAVSAIAIDGNREANAITFSPEGHELAFGCGKQLMIYEPSSGRSRPFAAADDEVFAIRYSPDRRLVAYGDRRGTVTLCERLDGRVVSRKEKAHPPHLYGLAFSPDGRLLATSGADSTIKLWLVESDGLRLQSTLRGHMGSVNTLAWSPDGTRLVSPSGDQTLKIWDPHRGALLATLYGHHGLAATARFTKDGCTIYCVGMDGEIRFWEAPPLAEVDLSGNRTPVETRSGGSLHRMTANPEESQ